MGFSNLIDYVFRHRNQCPMGVVDVLTHVKVHKVVGSLAVDCGDDSDDTEDELSCSCVIAFLSTLFVRTKLDLTMLVEVETTASDDVFGLMEQDTPYLAATEVLQNMETKTRPMVSVMGSLLNGVTENPSRQLSLVVRTNHSASGT